MRSLWREALVRPAYPRMAVKNLALRHMKNRGRGSAIWTRMINEAGNLRAKCWLEPEGGPCCPKTYCTSGGRQTTLQVVKIYPKGLGVRKEEFIMGKKRSF